MDFQCHHYFQQHHLKRTKRITIKQGKRKGNEN